VVNPACDVGMHGRGKDPFRNETIDETDRDHSDALAIRTGLKGYIGRVSTPRRGEGPLGERLVGNLDVVRNVPDRGVFGPVNDLVEDEVILEFTSYS
jgi:hypothetical protein